MSIFKFQGWLARHAPLPTTMIRLFIFLILWTLKPHFTLQMSARTLQSLRACACLGTFVLYLALT